MNDCPIVRGASHRVSIPYKDPKVADDTPTESAAYDERCAQIAREMLFAFSLAE
jgi:arsenate reductase (thioredoxin)